MNPSDDTPFGISRRSFLAGTVALCALDYDILRAGTTVDTPTIIRGPYIQRSTDTSMVVMWRTDIECDTRVNFGTQAGQLDLVFYATALETDHTARIIGLQPNTKYYYDVGTDDEVLGGGTLDHYFVTAPAIGEAKPTRFAWSRS